LHRLLFEQVDTKKEAVGITQNKAKIMAATPATLGAKYCDQPRGEEFADRKIVILS